MPTFNYQLHLTQATAICDAYKTNPNILPTDALLIAQSVTACDTASAAAIGVQDINGLESPTVTGTGTLADKYILNFAAEENSLTQADFMSLSKAIEIITLTYNHIFFRYIAL